MGEAMSATTAGLTAQPQSYRSGRARRLARQLLHRLTGSILVLLASATITFIALHLMPGDPVTAILGGPTANPTPETVAAAIKEYGLDKPVTTQYALYLARLLHGDLGVSFSQHMRVADVLREQIGPTLLLTASSLLTAWGVALVSVIATVKRSRLLDGVGGMIETMSASVPQFWLGILLLWLFAFRWQILPPAGNGSLAALVLPSLSLAIPLGGFIAKVTRESLELALEQPFILSARTRGLGDFQVRIAHALRHAVLPGLSLSAWAIGALLGNAVVTETIFSRQGIGRQLFLAVCAQDMPLTVGITLFVTIAYVAVSIVIDIIIALIDPRLAGDMS
jgi:peptide/nickel transport system permease protein